MARSNSNFHHNYPRVIKYLKSKDIPYNEYNGGQHLKILGAVTAIELWPSRMTYHVLMSEHPESNKYNRLSFKFNETELDSLLNK